MESLVADDVKALVGRNIVLARKMRGWTQGQLCRELKAPQKQVSDWERGKHQPRPEWLQRIARVVGQEFAWFYSDHPNLEAHYEDDVDGSWRQWAVDPRHRRGPGQRG
jgi:transcriptional regulator with XRE-family HTH domain